MLTKQIETRRLKAKFQAGTVCRCSRHVCTSMIRVTWRRSCTDEGFAAFAPDLGTMTQRPYYWNPPGHAPLMCIFESDFGVAKRACVKTTCCVFPLI